MAYEFRSRVWEHTKGASWHFVTLPEDVADEIEERTVHRQRGFGSVKVVVTIGATTWSTSLFPDTKAGSYVLPVKKPVRNAEKIEEGDEVEVSLVVVDLDGDQSLPSVSG